MNIADNQVNKGFFATINSQKSDHSLVSFVKPVEVVSVRFYPEAASIKLANTIIQSETVFDSSVSGHIVMYVQESNKWQLIEQIPVSALKNGTTVAIKKLVRTSKILVKSPQLNVSFLVCYRELADNQILDLNLLSNESATMNIKSKILNKKFPYLDSVTEPLSNYVQPMPQTSEQKPADSRIVSVESVKDMIRALDDRTVRQGMDTQAERILRFFDESALKALNYKCEQHDVS